MSDDFDPADAEFIGCWPTKWSRSKVPGSIVDYCSVCKQEVNVAPTSQAIMDKVRLLCIPCGTLRLRNNPAGGDLRLFPGQAAEIEREMRRRAEEDEPPVRGL